MSSSAVNSVNDPNLVRLYSDKHPRNYSDDAIDTFDAKYTVFKNAAQHASGDEHEKYYLVAAIAVAVLFFMHVVTLGTTTGLLVLGVGAAALGQHLKNRYAAIKARDEVNENIVKVAQRETFKDALRKIAPVRPDLAQTSSDDDSEVEDV